MSGYVVDTNVISESIKKSPNPAAIEWLSAHASELYLTSITIEELRFGEYMMPKGKKRRALKRWIDSLQGQYARCIYSFDAACATTCAKFHEKAIASGHAPAIEDLMIASIAHEHDAPVVTRNIKDFEYLGVKVINPFEAQMEDDARAR